MTKIGSLFSGIGGLELGLEWAGVGETIWQVENNPFCQRVLAKHWPGVTRYSDVKEVSSKCLENVDLVCGGFPCQDVSSAGKRKGIVEGTRSGLWIEFHRIVSELRPEYVLVENVASGARKWLPRVRQDLSMLGYSTTAVSLSAADVGAPHLRRRVFVIAHPNGVSLRIEQQRRPGRRKGAVQEERQDVALDDGFAQSLADYDGGRSAEGRSKSRVWPWSSEPDVGRVAYGIPDRVDRLTGLGNAVVPQCSEVIGRMLVDLRTK